MTDTVRDRSDGKIRKGRSRRVAKGDPKAQMKFIEKLFVIAA